VFKCRDITEVSKFEKLSIENKMLNLMTSSVSHELITPLKCIMQIGDAIVEDTIDAKI